MIFSAVKPVLGHCQAHVSLRLKIVAPAKFEYGTGFLVLSHWFVVLSFEFIFDFSVRIWYNGFRNWSGELLDKSEFVGMNYPFDILQRRRKTK